MTKKKHEIKFIHTREGFGIECENKKVAQKLFEILPMISEEDITAELINKATPQLAMNMRFAKFVEMTGKVFSDKPISLPQRFGKFDYLVSVSNYDEEIVYAMTRFVMYCLKNQGMKFNDFPNQCVEAAEKILEIRLCALMF